MARQSFRGAGGGGAVVVPHVRHDADGAWNGAAEEPALEVDRRVGALLFMVSAILTLTGIFAAGGALVG